MLAVKVGYKTDGQDLILGHHGLSGGLLARGPYSNHLLRKMLWEFRGLGTPVFTLLLSPPSADTSGLLGRQIKAAQLAGYVFGYSKDDQVYPAALASCLSFALSLDEPSEFLLRDILRYLASEVEMGGPGAIQTLVEEGNGRPAELLKRRIRELTSISPSVFDGSLNTSAYSELWRVSPPSSRLALALASASKYAGARDEAIIVLYGWEAILSKALESQRQISKLREIMNEIRAKNGVIIAVEEGGPAEPKLDQLFGANVEKRGLTFFLQLRGGITTSFLIPHILVKTSSNPEDNHALDPVQVDHNLLMKVLETVSLYPNVTQQGILSFLGAEFDRNELSRALSYALERGYVAYLDSAANRRTLILTGNGSRILKEEE